MVTADAEISSSNPSVLAVERAGKLVGVTPGTVSYTHLTLRQSLLLRWDTGIAYAFHLLHTSWR